MTGKTTLNGVLSWGNWRRTAFPALAISLSVVLTLAASEISLRLSGARSAVLHAEMFRTENDPLLPYSLQPGYAGYYAGGRVTVGEDGNRLVPDRSPEGGAATGSVVVLGDSVAFGQGLDDEDTIAANLERLLADKKRPLGVQLVSAPGYTSWNEFAALSRLADLGKTRVVVLIYVNNDLTKDNDQFKLSANGGGIADVEHDFSHRLTGALYDHSRLAFIIADIVKRLRANFNSSAPRDGPGEIDRDALTYSMTAIGKIKKLCDAHGIRLIVAVYRDATSYSLLQQVGDYETAMSRSLSNVPVENFVLARHIEALPQERSRMSWNDPAHPSAEATQIIAQQIFDELDKRGWIRTGT